MMARLSHVAVAVLLSAYCGAAAHAQGDPFDDIGHLNSLERQAEFWEAATGTAYVHGDCGFFLAPAAGDETAEVVASIASGDGGDPLVWSVGTFQLTVSLPIERPQTAAAVEETDAGLMIMVEDLERNIIAGHVVFNTGLATDLTAVSFTSGTTEVVSSHHWEGDNIFVPIRTHGTAAAAAIDAEVTSLAYTALSVPPPDKDLSDEEIDVIEGGDDPDCPWVWCHRPDQFCQDIAQCVADRDAELANAWAIRATCLAAAQAGYIGCLDLVGCWVNGNVGGGLGCAAADIACSAARSLAEAACRSAYLGLVTAAEWNFQACGANAKANDGQVVPGCDCPEGWEPFPTQAPPSWGHVDCADVFGVWGLTWSYELIFDWE
jgi:hypothetical protein